MADSLDFSSLDAAKQTLKQNVLLPVLTHPDDYSNLDISINLPDYVAAQPCDALTPSLFSIDSYEKLTDTSPPALRIKASYSDSLPVQSPSRPSRPVQPTDYRPFDIFCLLTVVVVDSPEISGRITVAPQQPLSE